MTCKRRDGDAVLVARKRFVEILQMRLYVREDIAALHDIFVDFGQILLDALDILCAETMFLDHLVPEGAPVPQIVRDVALRVQQIHSERLDLLGRNSGYPFNRL